MQPAFSPVLVARFRRSLVAFFVGVCWPAFMLCSMPAQAQDSYSRRYDEAAGFNFNGVWTLVQDDKGFLWLGTGSGLVRFDGRNFIRWSADRIDEGVPQLAQGPNDELLIGGFSGQAWRRTSAGSEPLHGPDGKPIANLKSFVFDAQGNLWAILADELWLRDGARQWQRVELDFAKSQKLDNVYAAGKSVVVLTNAAAWRLHIDRPVELVAQGDFRRFAGDDDSAWLANSSMEVMRIRAGERPAVIKLRKDEYEFPVDMKLRGSTLWIATIHGVLAVEADGRIRRKAVSEGVGKYRSLLIDREGSLWLGTFAGLLQFPEPDTWNWLHARVVGIWQTADTIWVQAPDWSIYRVEKTTGELVQDALKGVLCVTPNQQVSAVFADKIYSWRGSSFRSGEFKAIADMPVPVDMSHHLYCEADHNGTLWVGTNEGLFRLAPGRDKAIRINFPGLSPDDIHPFWFDAGDDRPWTLLGDRVCRLQADNDGNTTVSECVVSGTALGYAYSALRIDAQRLWISDFSVYELGADTGLRRLPGNRDFADAKVSHLAPAADGHAWLSGGTATRVRPCDDCADGWQIVERLSSWHGLTGNTNQVVETADGDVWIGGLTGIWRVPKRVRDTPLSVPRVIAVHAQVDADVRDLTAPIEVAPSDHRLELEFATLTYRDRSLLRFRSRFGDNGKWSTPVQDSHLQFAALEPGNYHVEAEASLDGEHWSEQPATIDFKVLPPWYRTWWAYVLYLLAVLGLIALFVRQRVAAALRVERERTRIAMDLHDEIGSGLGSIGMLAGAAKRSSASEQLRLVGEIGDLASLLSSGLRSVVWSLRSGKAGIVELGEQIADQARRLFTHGAPNLELHLPDRGTVVPVPSDVHRNTLMIAFEALHNIARHAHAGSVRVSLGAGADAGFVLVIEDDGAGFRPDEQFAGAGLESMRRRADAIGAHYAVASNAGRGTRITLAYPARSP